MSEKHKKKIPVIHRPKTAEDKDLTHITEAMGGTSRITTPKKPKAVKRKKEESFPKPIFA